MLRFRFTDEKDESLLIQYRADKPFNSEYSHVSEVWQSIGDNLERGKVFLTPRAARDRFLFFI